MKKYETPDKEKPDWHINRLYPELHWDRDVQFWRLCVQHDPQDPDGAKPTFGKFRVLARSSSANQDLNVPGKYDLEIYQR